MPTMKNWLYFALVNFLIMGYIVCLYYLTSLQEIKANWPLYRCNPMYMPLSDNIEQDFTYCVQNMQGNFILKSSKKNYHFSQRYTEELIKRLKIKCLFIFIILPL